MQKGLTRREEDDRKDSSKINLVPLPSPSNISKEKKTLTPLPSHSRTKKKIYEKK
jgi:hypothetical protein